MRLISYGPFGSERAGISLDRGILDLAKAMQATGNGAPTSDMRVFLEQEGWRSMLDQMVKHAKIPTVKHGSTRIGAPVPVPRKLIIAGANTHR